MYYYQLPFNRLRSKYQSDWKGLSNPMREATLFRKVIELYPIHIQQGDLIAGWYGFDSKERMEALYEDFVPLHSDVELLPQGDGSPEKCLQKNGVKAGRYDRGHYELDYQTLLARGINAYLGDVEKELQRSDMSDAKKEYLLGMKAALACAEVFSNRYAELAEQMATQATDEKEKSRLLRMSAACRRLPMNPARDFFEAVQSAYLIWSLNCISYGEWVSVSFGSFDRFMYPYYQSSKENGMTDGEVIGILLQLFRMLDVYNGVDCVLSVGGMDEHGNDLTNELSYLIVEAEKRSRLRSPLFVARINKNTPQKLMRELISSELFEIGQPSFYSEENCLSAMMKRGIDEKTARNYGVSTCMNFVIPGSEVTHGWGCMLNTHLPLELALNNGQPICGTLPIDFQTKPRGKYKNTDEILDQYRSYLREIFEIAMTWQQENTARCAKEFPNPWLSALTNDCIRRGCDRWDGGAVYHNLIVEAFGFAHTADAVTAIERLVFEEKKYSIEELIKAARADYGGYETLRKDLLQCEKYGMNHDRADRNARRVLSLVCDVCEENRTENRRYLPSLHTLWYDVEWGGKRPAFLDGRHAGEPVNKNAGPSPLVRSAGPTSIALSACKIDQTRLNGGQALDVHIGIRNLDTERNRDKIAAYIQTYFQLGGLQLQINGLTAQTLQNAYEHPEKYPVLMVRIGGHSRYFNEFNDRMKKDFIQRFRLEEGVFSI